MGNGTAMVRKESSIVAEPPHPEGATALGNNTAAALLHVPYEQLVNVTGLHTKPYVPQLFISILRLTHGLDPVCLV